ncbi:QWRF domain containing 2 [Hibiscus trionum]|uniref:QWRF domain containing 2 n=1 Tax=Hibiscus trionum TaxID=183268 RepID=A0A9W7J4Q7_HIBTR|nr:QWRF domain containing 2 [Hibiscus trionum]
MAAAFAHSVEETKSNGSSVTRKPKGKQVSSMYLSPSSSPATMNASSTSKPAPMTVSLLPKQSRSVDRRRPGGQLSQGNNVNAVELPAVNKMMITSRRSLSVSFQGEAFSLPFSKIKAQEGSNLTRTAVPESCRASPVRDHGENSKPVDPGKTRNGNSGSNPLSSSLNYGIDRKAFRSHAMLDDSSSRRVSFDGPSARRLSLDFGGAAEMLKEDDKPKPNAVSCDLTASDTDSVSSGSTNSGMQECVASGLLKGRSLPLNIGVSARFWQETNSRLRRLQDPSSPFCASTGSRIGGSAKFSQSKRFSSDGAMPSLWTRPASPSKLWTPSASSTSRGLSSARVRNAVGGQMIGNSINTPLNLSFSVDIWRGKNGEDRIVDARVLRLLYNRYLQWRFANAKADATFMTQKLSAEKYLWSARMTTSDLRHSVTLKRIKLLLLRQKLKLTSILKGQIAHLEAWTLLESDHSSSLLGVTEALKASTLRLPIVRIAIADIQDLKNAVSSAGDVMQAITSSICALSSKVEEMNSLVAKLASETTKERVLLEQCKDYLSALAALQVKDCSLRTHIIQLNHASN